MDPLLRPAATPMPLADLGWTAWLRHPEVVVVAAVASAFRRPVTPVRHLTLVGCLCLVWHLQQHLALAERL